MVYRKYHYDPEEIVALYRQGLTYKAIAKQIGCPHYTVCNVVSKSGIANRQHNRSPEVLADIKEMYATGVPTSEISKKHSISPYYIHTFCREQALVKRPTNRNGNPIRPREDDQRKQIQELYQQGCARSEIVKRLGVSAARVSYILRHFGPKPTWQRAKRSAVTHEAICTEYTSGDSVQTIAEKHGWTVASVRALLGKRGVTRPKQANGKRFRYKDKD